MVKKMLFNLLVDYGARVGKSVTSAYQKVISSAGKAGSSTSSGSTFDSMKEKMGSLVKTPMTMTEAIGILNIVPKVEPEVED